MKKIALRSITAIVSIVAMVVPFTASLTWYAYSPEIPQELKDKWSV
ncbi:hypothetical protein [Paenibacillus sedimenti]|uniref:Cyclic lactone autoinducer peptide n=1 Tax=Paenibacillus sedimenti TaxID=2770274 RepID=A0A926KQ59_9BACL|nr:hypothetical protein [Paenibacillus sedimenti]MBD0381121.1 hypothetical protein [Paenibacillus sedimenti]